MKTRLCLVLGITAALGLSSCNEDRIISNTQLVKSITVSVQDFQDVDAGTRATYTVDGTGFHFTWSAGDTVGIYPVGGDQVAFPISNGEGSQTAKFDGGAWALRSSCSYAAYYPFEAGNYHVKETNLSVSYRGQTQNGNGSLDCLDNFDYQASVATRPDADGNVNIALKHLGCFVRFQLTMPVADTLKSITLTSSKTPFITSGKYDLTQESIAITPSSTLETFSVSLSNTFTTPDNKILTIYAMMAPQDLSNSEIGILIKGTKYDSYTATVYGKNMLAGKAFNYKATVQSGTNISGKDVEWDEEGQEMTPSSIINFADERVKALCVSNWDTDGDGNLSMAEAAAVTDLGYVFKRDTIKSFNELKYFTGLTSIGTNAFEHCHGLISIEIPNSVTSRGEDAFEGWYNLSFIEIPNSVTSIGNEAFYCSGLTSITIPSSVINIGECAIDECSKLESIVVDQDNPVYDSRDNCNALIETASNRLLEANINMTTIPNGIVRIGFCAYDGCNNMISINLPESVTTIDSYAFASLKDVTTIIIPKSVTSIGEGAFYKCTGLTDVYCHLVVIPKVNTYELSSFYCVDLSSVTLHVPEEMIEEYRATEPWKDFGTIVPLSTSNSEPQYEYVDLGLSVKWATFNVGATKPEEYGDYYAWGETEPKTDYSLSTYKWCDGSNYIMTKYCNDSNYGNNGFTDTLTVLDPEDDVAHVKWGGSWRMPTKDEQDELRDKCTWTWYSSGNTEFNGVAGYKVTSKKEGYTGRYIFLPSAGCRYETGLYNAGFVGYYRSSSLYTGRPYDAWYVDFDSSDVRADYYYHRYYGLSVRPVCP